VRQELFAKLY